MAKNPKTGRGKKRLYEVACVAWFDLLGYGSMLEKVSFDPTAALAEEALNRLNEFHEFTSKHANRYFRIHAINDGVIIFNDMSPRASTKTFDFLDRLLKLYSEFNFFEQEKNLPGARMVISVGFRVRIKAQIIKDEQTKLGNIFKRIADGIISFPQAINEAFKAKPFFGYIPELQANFAFTKSYLVDNAGTKGGFGGANCYIDMALFSTTKLDWLEFDSLIEWEGMGMKATYGKLKKQRRDIAIQQKHKEVLDAFEIAKNISKEDDITNILVQSTVQINIRKK